MTTLFSRHCSAIRLLLPLAALLICIGGCKGDVQPQPPGSSTSTAANSSPHDDREKKLQQAAEQLAGTWVWDKPLDLTTFLVEGRDRSKPDTIVRDAIKAQRAFFEAVQSQCTLQFSELSCTTQSGVPMITGQLTLHWPALEAGAEGSSKSASFSIHFGMSPQHLKKKLPTDNTRPTLDTLYIIAELPPMFGQADDGIADTHRIVHPLNLAADGRQLVIDSAVIFGEPTNAVIPSDDRVHGIFRKADPSESGGDAESPSNE